MSDGELEVKLMQMNEGGVFIRPRAASLPTVSVCITPLFLYTNSRYSLYYSLLNLY